MKKFNPRVLVERNGKFSFRKIGLILIVAHVLFAVIFFGVAYLVFDDEIQKYDAIDSQISSHPLLKKEVGRIVIHSDALLLTDISIDSLNRQRYGVYYTTNLNYQVVFGFWYKNTPPNYPIDSLEILAKDPKKGDYSYAFKTRWENIIKSKYEKD